MSGAISVVDTSSIVEVAVDDTDDDVVVVVVAVDVTTLDVDVVVAPSVVAAPAAAAVLDDTREATADVIVDASLLAVDAGDTLADDALARALASLCSALRNRASVAPVSIASYLRNTDHTHTHTHTHTLKLSHYTAHVMPFSRHNEAKRAGVCANGASAEGSITPPLAAPSSTNLRSSNVSMRE
jgi:hypothetical protein